MADIDGVSLQGLLASLPPNVNPYDALLTTIARLVTPAANTTAVVFWVLDSALLGINACLGLAVLVGRFRQREFYLLRRRRVPSGTVYVPDSGVLFAVFSSVFALLAQPYIFTTMAAQNANHLTANALKIETGVLPYIFTCLALAFFSELQAMCLLMYLSKKRLASLIPAWLFNLFFAVFYITVISTLVTLFTISFVRWTHLIDLLNDISAPLKTASKTWTHGQTLDSSRLVGLLPLMDELEQRSSSYLSITQAGYSVLLSIVIAIVGLYVPAGVSYILLLRERLRFREARRKTNQEFIGNRAASIPISPFRLMMYKTLVVFVACVCAGIAAGWLACDYPHVVSDQVVYALVNQLCFFAFAVLAWIVLSLLTYSAWQDELDRLWSSLSRQGRLDRKTRHVDMSVMDINVAIEMIVVEEVDDASSRASQVIKLPTPIVELSPMSDIEEKGKTDFVENFA